jgi:hypothetical protein
MLPILMLRSIFLGEATGVTGLFSARRQSRKH